MIELNNPEQATKAAQWCKKNKIKYDLEYWGWPGNTRYRFIFDNDKDLSLFTLKWI